MNRTAWRFMAAAVLYGLAGFALGTYMGAAHDFAMRSVHSHLNLVGWATLAIAALFYQTVASAARSTLSAVHFWVANAGMIIMTVCLALEISGRPEFAPGIGIGSILVLISFIIFTVVVFRSADARA